MDRFDIIGFREGQEKDYLAWKLKMLYIDSSAMFCHATKTQVALAQDKRRRNNPWHGYLS
ncbi:MAG: hypothetical protein MUO52_06755 [Desulfobacterales bacterium]|nr:hypothetical protein [Desulfobacterales bacterium]